MHTKLLPGKLPQLERKVAVEFTEEILRKTEGDANKLIKMYKEWWFQEIDKRNSFYFSLISQTSEYLKGFYGEKAALSALIIPISGYKVIERQCEKDKFSMPMLEKSTHEHVKGTLPLEERGLLNKTDSIFKNMSAENEEYHYYVVGLLETYLGGNIEAKEATRIFMCISYCSFQEQAKRDYKKLVEKN